MHISCARDESWQRVLFLLQGPQMKVSVLDTEVGLYHHRSKGVDWVFVDHPSYPRPGGLYADAFGVYGDNQVNEHVPSLIVLSSTTRGHQGHS